jgi:hypothetical protein
MCEPTTILLVASAVGTAYGAYSMSESNKAQAEYQSDMAANNAKVSNWQAEDAVVRGGEAAIQQQRQAERMRGTQVARLASNGLDISSGTPLAILEDTMYFGSQDANMIRNNAAREAWGHKVQASGATASSAMFASAAGAENPTLAAGTSLLSSAGQYAAAGGFKSGTKTTQSGRS